MFHIDTKYRRVVSLQGHKDTKEGKHQRVTTIKSAPEERMHDGRHIPETSRVSLSPGAQLATCRHHRCTHQVPVIVHKLTSLGQLLLLARGFTAVAV